MPSGFMYDDKQSWHHVYEVIQKHPGIRTGMIQFVLAGQKKPLSHNTIENALTKLRREGKIRTVRKGSRGKYNYVTGEEEKVGEK